MKSQITLDGRRDSETGAVTVRMNGRRLDPARSQKVWNHSPDGFNWGYGGSGSAQLALAVLLSAGVPEPKAVRLHQLFKAAFLQELPGDDFHLDVRLADWIAEREHANAIGSGE